MSKGKYLNGPGGIERNFFDMIDFILREYCINQISMDEVRARNRARIVSYLAHVGYPKTWQLEALKTMGQLDELLWKKKAPGATA
jgi:hypothetical protein